MRATLSCLVAMLVFCVLASLYFPFTSDDAFIALRFAHNLSRGLGPCFNLGEPSYGFTSPLWVYLLALLKGLGADLLLSSKTMSFLAGVGGMVLFVLLLRPSVRHLSWFLLGLLAWATDPWLLRWSPSGMEASLSAALVLLSLFLFGRGTKAKGGLFLAGLCMGLTFLIRPEGALLAVGALIALTVERKWKGFLCLFLGFLLPTLPWLFYAQATFHRLLPNTFSAKAGPPTWADSLRSLIRTLKIVGPTYFLELLGLILGAFCLVKKGEAWRALRRNIVLVIWVLGLPFVYILAGVGVQSRYLLMVIPLVVLLGVRAWEVALEGSGRILRSTAWSLVLVLILGTNLGFTFGYNYPTTMRFSRGVEQCLIPLGKYLKENTSQGAQAALVDIGAVGYYSERRIVDLGGLIHPQLLPLIVKHPREKILPYLPIAGYGRPEYFITRAPRPGPETFPGLTPLLTKEFGPLGVSDPQTVWTYTLYQVNWDSLGGHP